MPTGYTAKLCEEGQSFPDFVFTCARAFGALILMRDEPLDATIPEVFEPSDLYLKMAAETKAKVERLSAMSAEEQIAEGERLRDEAIAAAEEYLAKARAQDARLQEMREKVIKWAPPTPEHEGLRNFMLAQIEMSFDGDAFALELLDDARRKTPRDYFKQALENERQNITRYSTYHREEIDRTAKRNDWLSALRQSLS